MIKFLPFKAVRFTEIANRFDVPPISLPYDKINENHLKEYEKNPFNISKIILPGGIQGRDYTLAKKLYQEFLQTGALKVDPTPSFYLYSIKFQVDGKTFKRTHIIGILRLPEYNENFVFPHERTFPKTVEDRLNLLRATQVNFGLIFLLGKSCKFPEIEEDERYTLHNEIHTVSRISDPFTIKKIIDCFQESSFVIADGHHRFKTALIYRDEMRKLQGLEGPFNYRMVAVTSIDDPGIVILPTHRATKNLIVPDNAQKLKGINELFDYLKKLPSSIGILTLEGTYILRNEKRLLPTEFLEEEIFARYPAGEITYFRSIGEGLKLLEKGNKTLFIVNPPDVETVWNYATQGKLMPQKSTDFYPKLATGVTLFDHRLSYTRPEDLFKEGSVFP